MITANKGEWSELYALFKLLCDGELSAGDENLNKINNLIYPVNKVVTSKFLFLCCHAKSPYLWYSGLSGCVVGQNNHLLNKIVVT